jgi:hypothetical protein
VRKNKRPVRVFGNKALVPFMAAPFYRAGFVIQTTVRLRRRAKPAVLSISLPGRTIVSFLVRDSLNRNGTIFVFREFRKISAGD